MRNKKDNEKSENQCLKDWIKGNMDQAAEHEAKIRNKIKVQSAKIKVVIGLEGTIANCL
ncbi:MAG: hypothetical protein KBC43_09560 [Bacteroidales bacterium]|nr:hypothetical protein [Bacteroidales bacterium]